MNRHRNAIRGSISSISALFAHPQQPTIMFLIISSYVIRYTPCVISCAFQTSNENFY